MTINANDLSTIKRGYVRETDTGKLRRWIKLLLDDRDQTQDELVKLRGYKPSISPGSVDSTKGRDETPKRS